MKIWLPHKLGLPYLHDLPAAVDIEVADDPATLPSDPETVTFFVPTVLDQPQFHDVVPRMRALAGSPTACTGWCATRSTGTSPGNPSPTVSTAEPDASGAATGPT
ncbi:Rossmann-fold NAD(P)-binding domain-containing protein [Micromonospora chokoriensis]|uniref:Uncharacterized protein n=1 Tax=Micromonospora chokoriensis TaxID=356851 RepID=A0A1C4XDN7_9ACTN|nr:hypothetical protein [Micromonospora chokoriensis]SCF06414.1 hypothetical protein GA0070612_3473 [Micromonospora chokoriensis]